MSRDDERERTPEERERARLEREARRAARRGEPPPAPPPREPAPPPSPAPAPREPEPPPPPPPPPPEVEPTRPPEPMEPLSSEPPLPLADAPREVDPPEERPLRPGRTPRVSRDRVADRAAAARVALRNRRKREAATAPKPRRPREPGSGRSTLFRVAVAVGVVLVLVALWFLVSLFQPFKGDGEGTVRVQIPTGATVTQIGDILEENDVISNAFFFRTRVTVDGSRGNLKPGSYKLRRDMSYAAAIDALSEGPPKDIITITIPEGRSRGEIAPLVEQAGIDGSYRRASVRSPAINLRRYRAGGAESLEGFLFPATYELKRGASASDLVTKQVDTFEDQFATVDMREARRKNLTPYDVLIIASMVEREAGVAKDRPLIASVIYNRLKAGIPLGIDATIRYALGNWTQPLKESELALDTPYNTRRVAGLTPGPIGNPGLESIQAAANPAKSDYLFFVVKPCGDGEHAFSETDAEFQRDVARYNAERDRQGGRSPTDC